MASSQKLISFFFLLTLFSVQIYARESQFFSKVSGTTTTIPTTATTSGKDNTFPSKEEENFKKQEQEPTFMQENQNGYGLYGQESYEQESNTQFPTTTKLANEPYTTTTTTAYNPYNTQTQTQSQETYTNYPNTNTNYYNNNQYNNNNNNNGYFQEQQQQQQQNFGETSLQESSYNGANGYTQQGRQGMSDTRYMEDGKYYYDLRRGNNYYPNQYQNSRNNNYDTKAYSYYNNNNNNKNAYGYNKYSMESQQEDFQDSQFDEQYVP